MTQFTFLSVSTIYVLLFLDNDDDDEEEEGLQNKGTAYVVNSTRFRDKVWWRKKNKKHRRSNIHATFFRGNESGVRFNNCLWLLESLCLSVVVFPFSSASSLLCKTCLQTQQTTEKISKPEEVMLPSLVLYWVQRRSSMTHESEEDALSGLRSRDEDQEETASTSFVCLPS